MTNYLVKCIWCFVLPFVLIRCAGSEPKSDNTEPAVVQPEVAEPAPIDAFNSFLGLSYGSEEHLIQNALGKFSSGNYTPDSSAFVYYFNRVDRVPISVWVSTETGKVITIFMEVLSLGENFDIDLQNAVDEFGIYPEDAAWFGLSAKDIKSKMGDPAEEAISADDVLLLSYDSKDYFITVAFKIYPQQEDRCGSVSVNWFY